MERALHLALAAVAVMGWALVYTTLTRGMHAQDVARNSPRTEISANLGPPQTPSIAATPASLR